MSVTPRPLPFERLSLAAQDFDALQAFNTLIEAVYLKEYGLEHLAT